MTDLDHEAAERYAETLLGLEWDADNNLARCYQASRAREKRLEALVRSLGECPECEGFGERRMCDIDADQHVGDCEVCAGTGLVEAAREELENG